MIPHRQPGSHPNPNRKKGIIPASIPTLETITYASFAAGLDMTDGPEDTQNGSSPAMVDMEVTLTDQLVKGPGTMLVEDTAFHPLRHLFIQASLDYTSELVALDAPFIGFKSDAGFEWYNPALPHGLNEWVAANVAGVLVFTDGDNTGYARQPNTALLETLTDMPPGRTVATAFGRIFVGAPKLSSVEQSLAIAWNAASGDYTDWVGLGSGAELLINDMGEADRVVALRPMGFNLLAILLRKSIWIGQPTGDAFRPADFQPRASGIGCFSEKTAVVGLEGVYFLSDDGVYIFDGSSVRMISAQINAGLVPLDYTQVNAYSAAYDHTKKRYILATPGGTWVYEATKNRWFFRSGTFDRVIGWSDQGSPPTWEDLSGSWESLGSALWSTLVNTETGTPARVFFAAGTLLGVEDYTIFTNINSQETFAPYWTSIKAKRDMMTEMVQVHGFAVEYENAGDLEFWTPNAAGDYINRAVVRLPSSSGFSVAKVPIQPVTGLNAGLRVVMGQGNLILSRLHMILAESSERVGSAKQLPILITMSGAELVSQSGSNLIARGG